MKVACVLVLCVGLFSASNAQLNFDFGLDTLKDLGQSVLDKLVDQVKDLAVDTGKDLLNNVVPGLGDLIGKRDVSSLSGLLSDLGDKLEDLTQKGKKLAAGVFSDAMDKFKSLAETIQATIGTITDASQITSLFDSVVADHHTRQKRIIGTLVQKGKDLVAGAVKQIKDAASQLKEGASVLLGKLIQTGVDVVGKRGLTDHLQRIGDALGPYIQPLTDLVGNAGETLKGHFSNLVDVVKGHATTLKTKLDPHISDLKDHGQKLLDHGKNAVGALSEVVKDILTQTMNNAGDTLTGVSKTLGDAGKTVADHFTGADDESSL